MNAGVVAPAGDLSSFTSMGYTVAATAGVHHSLIPLGISVEGSWTELAWSDHSGVKRRIYGLSVDGTADFSKVATNGSGLYMRGGVGYFGWETLAASSTPSRFGTSGSTPGSATFSP